LIKDCRKGPTEFWTLSALFRSVNQSQVCFLELTTFSGTSAPEFLAVTLPTLYLDVGCHLGICQTS
jgi:hypothetical protein